jgi:non-ribosomal peptide synthase protein (TIGR01720 family)
VGWFTALFPVALDLTEAASPVDAVRAVVRQLRAVPRGGVGYGILRYLTDSAVGAGEARPEISFNYLGQFGGDPGPADLFRPADEPAGVPRSPGAKRRHLIDVSGGVFDGRLRLRWTYSRHVHDHATIEALATGFLDSLQRVIQAGAGAAGPDGTPSPSAPAPGAGAREEPPVEGEVPLTPIQRQCMQSLGPEFQRNVVGIPLECTRTVTAELVEQAVRHVTRHHDALRLQLRQGPSGWQQWNAGLAVMDGTPLVECVDLSGLASADDVNACMAGHLSRLVASIDLSTPPLLRAIFADLGPSRPQQLLLAVHHFAYDTVSARILREDLQSAYEQLARGAAVSLPAKQTSFKEWAHRLRAYARSDDASREAAYWQSLPWSACTRLTASAEESLPLAMGTVTVSVDEEETGAILLAAQRTFRVRLEEVLLSALTHSLATLTGGRRFAIDLMHHGRVSLWDDVDVSRTVGWFSTAVPALLDVSGTGDATATLKGVSEQLRRMPNEGIGFGILKYFGDGAGPETAIAPEISLNHLGRIGGGHADALFRLARFGEGASFDMAPLVPRDHLIELTTYVYANRLCMQWQYRRGACPEAAIRDAAQRAVDHLRALIAGARAWSGADAVEPVETR